MTIKLDTLWTASGTTYSLGNEVIAQSLYAGMGLYDVQVSHGVCAALNMPRSEMKKCRDLESAEYYILHIACEYRAVRQGLGIDEQ